MYLRFYLFRSFQLCDQLHIFRFICLGHRNRRSMFLEIHNLHFTKEIYFSRKRQIEIYRSIRENLERRSSWWIGKIRQGSAWSPFYLISITWCYLLHRIPWFFSSFYNNRDPYSPNLQPSLGNISIVPLSTLQAEYVLVKRTSEVNIKKFIVIDRHANDASHKLKVTQVIRINIRLWVRLKGIGLSRYCTHEYEGASYL